MKKKIRLAACVALSLVGSGIYASVNTSSSQDEPDRLKDGQQEDIIIRACSGGKSICRGDSRGELIEVEF